MFRALSLSTFTLAVVGLGAPQARSQDLGSAGNFAVLAGSTATGTGVTTVTGDVGVWPGSAVVNISPTGEIHAGDDVAQQAQNDLTIAYNSLAGMAMTQELTGTDLGGLTLAPGVYRFSSMAQLSASTLFLDAQDNADAVFVFQIATTLTTANNTSIIMLNQGRGCNVYWQVGSSATLGTNSVFTGNILALASVTLTTGAVVSEGRLLARSGGVTLDSNTVTLAGCEVATVVARPQVSAEAGGRTTITYVDPLGHPVMLQRSTAGDWTSVALDDDAAPLSQTTNQFGSLTWAEPGNGKSFVAVASATGLFLVDTGAEPLAARNLTEEALANSEDASPITGASTVLTSADGVVNIIGMNDAGELIRYYQTGEVNDGQAEWAFMNISASQLLPQSLSTPEFASNLVSYASAWGGLHVAGLNSAGDVNTVWWAPGVEQWRTDNVSEQAETPPFMLSAGLTAYATPWGGLNLAGLDEQGNLTVQWWAPEFGEGNWQTSNLTESFGGASLDGVGLTSFVLPWGALNVSGVTQEGDLVNYWWLPGFDQWVITSITDATMESNPERLTGAMAGVGSADGVASIIGVSGNGDMIRYFWQPSFGGTWHSENVTQAANPG